MIYGTLLVSTSMAKKYKKEHSKEKSKERQTHLIYVSDGREANSFHL